MPLAGTSEIVAAARDKGEAVGAFNVITLEHAESIVAGAEAANRPVILQVSENAVKFHHGQLLPISRAAAEVAAGAGVPVALHLDHVQRDGLLYEAAEAGYSSVMYDASQLSYEDNVASTRAAAEWAHSRGLWLEAELGEVGGKDGAHAPGVRTDPDEAAAYVAATGVDALAVAVGSSHAMTTQTSKLDGGLIGRLRRAVPVPLVLHGSSGVPDDELRSAVRDGMVKVNVGTALNIAYSAAMRDSLAGPDAGVDPRKHLAKARIAMAETVSHLLGVLAG